MRHVIEHIPGGSIDLDIIIHERSDPVDDFPDDKFREELMYMGYKNLGEVIDNLDDILNRIRGRYPDFFERDYFTEQEVRDWLSQVE